MELGELQRHWEALARHDPLWAILSAPGKERGRWDEAEFFAAGAREVAGVLRRAEELGIRVERRAALDFGCGVGRLTQALGDHFQRVTGVDISPTMLAIAARKNRHGARCRYLLNQGTRLPLGDAEVDLVYTSLVLQHIAPAPAEAYLLELLRVLRPGGLLVFQLPRSLRRGSRVKDLAKRALLRLGLSGPLYRLRLLNSPAVMEAHCWEPAAVAAALARGGGRLLAEDQRSSPGGDDRLYFATR